MKVVLVVALACGTLYLLHRLALWAEDRGWIYYQRRKPSRTALGSAFLEVQAIVEPGKRLLLEARQEQGCEEDESGEPPAPTGVRAEISEGGGRVTRLRRALRRCDPLVRRRSRRLRRPRRPLFPAEPRGEGR